VQPNPLHGQLGLNDEDSRLVPTRVDSQRFAGAQVATVAAGAYHSAAVTEGGALAKGGRFSVFAPQAPHLSTSTRGPACFDVLTRQDTHKPRVHLL